MDVDVADDTVMVDVRVRHGGVETPPPLWGIGIQENFQGGQACYLHDGRALTFEDAIGFHGGEGAASQDAFQSLSDADRARRLHFLRSL